MSPQCSIANLTKLAHRLCQCLLYSKTAHPKVLENHFDTAVSSESQNYGRDKAKFALITGLVKRAIASAFIFTGFHACAWDLGGKITGYFGCGPEYEVATNPFVHRRGIDTHPQIVQSLAFCAIIFVASALPEIPVSVYETFVLEERHGFNKTMPGLFISDLLKTWALGFAIGEPFLSTFLYVFK